MSLEKGRPRERTRRRKKGRRRKKEVADVAAAVAETAEGCRGR